MSASTRSRGLAALAAIALLPLAACGGSTDTAGTGSATPSSATADSPASGSPDAAGGDVVAEAKAAVEMNRAGTDRALPAAAPKPQAGQNVWVISCLQVAEGCAVPAKGAEDAGKAMGWDMTVFDGQGAPDVYAKGIRAAIADKADGIILDVVDCVAAKSPLEEAKAAGIKIVANYSFDCNDPLLGAGGKPLFDAEVQYEAGKSYLELVEDLYSRSVADFVIAETEGKAKIIMFTQEDILVGQHLYKGFEKRIQECTGCEIVKRVPFTLQDLVTDKLQGKATAALTQSPDANVVYAPYDTAITLGIGRAVTAAGRDADVLVVGGEGLTPNVGFVRDGKGQDFIAGSPSRWTGWAVADTLNRVFAGEEQVDSGIGFQTLTTDSTLPKKTTYYDGNVDASGMPKQDYETNYKKIWAVS